AAQGVRFHGSRRHRPRLGLHASQGRYQLVPPVPRADHGLRRQGAGQAPENGAQRSRAQEAALDHHLGKFIVACPFYFGSGSPFAWKVWLTLEHKGIAYTAKRLSFDKDETRTPEFLAINPRGRVPAIVDDGFALYESNAICEYLEEKYPQNPLLPKDAKGR